MPTANKQRLPPGPPAKSYPFWEMDIGDHLSVRPDKRNSAAACASRWGKKNHKKFTVKWNDKQTEIIVLRIK
jgi:hypothetical protein